MIIDEEREEGRKSEVNRNEKGCKAKEVKITGAGKEVKMRRENNEDEEGSERRE